MSTGNHASVAAVLLAKKEALDIWGSDRPGAHVSDSLVLFEGEG